MRLVDRDGWVMPLVLSGRVIDVPVISGHLGLTDVTPGKQAASPALERGIEMAVVLQQMYSANGRISEIHLTEAKEIILLTAEGGIPVLAGHDRLEEKIRSFDAFWKQVVMRNDSQHLRLIDVRYQGQVIAKWHQAGQAKG
ncbi:MAG: cell division protein FtsQ, partial [Ignavibacteria bacterium]|nr:cell division protein FtsQ [Ignavibacteria bacterium]